MKNMKDHVSVVDHDLIVRHQQPIKMKVFDPMVNISPHWQIQDRSPKFSFSQSIENFHVGKRFDDDVHCSAECLIAWVWSHWNVRIVWFLKRVPEFFSLAASVGHTSSLIDVDKELFFWSVITGRRDFALLFWSRGKNKICKYNVILRLCYQRRKFIR